MFYLNALRQKVKEVKEKFGKIHECARAHVCEC